MIRELEFKVLCQRHRDEIYRYALGLLGNRADAEDAAQEVLLRLWNHLPRINPFNLRAWLLRTTRHYCLDQIRRRSNLSSPLLIDDEFLDARPMNTQSIQVSPLIPASASSKLATLCSRCRKTSAACSSFMKSIACVIAKSPRPSKSPSTA
jgi:RNA polymerase sigma factor (sigma-70 family)